MLCRNVLLALLSSVVMTASASAQECVREFIGLGPVQPTLTLPQWNAGLISASQIVRRAPNGTPSPTGKRIFLPIGMSNTAHVFGAFQPFAKPFLLPGTQLVNTAQSNQAAAQWADPGCSCWGVLLEKLVKVGTPAQVGAVFLMLTNAYPTLPPQQNATLFAQHVTAVLGHLRILFPNLHLVYLTSNYYGGYDVGQDKTPEPHGHDEHLTLQGLQDAAIADGRPWVTAASPVLWADGVRPRPWDGLTLECADISGDGVHLSSTGKAKYGRHLFDALRADPTTYGWLW